MRNVIPMATILQFSLAKRATQTAELAATSSAADADRIVELSRYRVVTDKWAAAAGGDFNMLLCLD